MPASITKLRKLRGRGLHELRERGRQELSKLTERLLGAASREMSDRALLQAISPALRNGSAHSTSALITTRMQASTAAAPAKQHLFAFRFFPTHGERETIIELMSDRFEGQRDALLARAERAIEGCFDLLGYRELSFGNPVDWRLEPVSGKRTDLAHWSAIDYLDPEVAGDKKITWELNRHSHFVAFGQAYWLTGDERFARAFVEQACSWMDGNPPRRGINWASSLEVSLRAIAWLWALHLMAGAEALTPRVVTRMLKCLVAHGRFISAYLSHYFSPNTHLTGEALGLVYLGSALPELSQSRRWRLKGLAILLEQLPLHVRPDGVYFEQATYYHRYTVDFYTHLLLLARACRLVLPREAEERLAAALDYLMWITRPDGTSPLIGDDDGGRLIALGDRSSNDFRDTLATGAALFGRGDWKQVAGDAAVETLWLLGPTGLKEYDHLVAAIPEEQARAFKDSRCLVMRDGWRRDSSCAMIECGTRAGAGAAHAHADALSFEFAVRGTNWLVDPGTFTYTGDPAMREWFRSSGAHNTVTVDGRSQSEATGPFQWGRCGTTTVQEFINEEGLTYFSGSHDGYHRLADPVTHSRSLLFVEGDGGSSLAPYLIIRDHFDAKARHRYTARFQLAAGCKATVCGHTAVASAESGDKLCLSSWSTPDQVVVVRDASVSSAYGSRVSAPAVVVESEGKGTHQIVSLIVPQSKNRGPASVARSKGVYSISTCDAFDLVACPDESQARSNLLAARCQIAWARFAGGRLSKGCLVSGTQLDVMGSFSLLSPAAIPWLSFSIEAGSLKIVTRGTNHFNIVAYGSVKSITVDGAGFELSRGARLISLTRAEAGWKLSARN